MRKLLVVSVLVMMGCASAETFRSNTNVYPPVKQSDVLLFFSAEDVKLPYEIVGEILMGGSSGYGVDCNDLIKKAQKKAGQMGANAIIASPCKDEGGARRVMSALFGTQDNTARVQAIRISR